MCDLETSVVMPRRVQGIAVSEERLNLLVLAKEPEVIAYPCLKTVCMAVAMLGVTLTANAQLTGSIYTTNSGGTIVQGSLFGDKTLVYLDGGPQNLNSGSGLPDGSYYFQVTDPSGKVLLSADDVSCR